MSTRERIDDLLPRIQNGERELMPELWDCVERLVKWQANRIITKLSFAQGVTFDDLYQSGYIALADTVERYEPREGGSFIALFMLRLKSAFAEACGARGKSGISDPLQQTVTKSLNAPISDDDDMTLEDTIADSTDVYEDIETRIYNEQLHDELERVFSATPANEADILRCRHYDGLSINGTAEALNITPERARQGEGYAFRDIRRSKHLRSLRQYIEDSTPYYSLHVGPQRFHSTNTSATEQIVLIRERLEERAVNRINPDA